MCVIKVTGHIIIHKKALKDILLIPFNLADDFLVQYSPINQWVGLKKDADGNININNT